MNIDIEFAGLSRVYTKVPKMQLELPEGTTYKQILRLLANQYPKLVGEVIHPNGETLQDSNMLNRNGRYMVQPADMDTCPFEGDRLILMSILAGG